MVTGPPVGDARARPVESPVHRRRIHVPPGRLGRALYALAGAAALFVIAMAGSIIEHVVYAGHVLPGVEVNGARVAGKKSVAASDAIARLAADLGRSPLHARGGDRRFTIEPAQIGFDVDTDTTTRNAQRDGRQGNPFALVAGTVMRRVRSDHVALVVRYDR